MKREESVKIFKLSVVSKLKFINSQTTFLSFWIHSSREGHDRMLLSVMTSFWNQRVSVSWWKVSSICPFLTFPDENINSQSKLLLQITSNNSNPISMNCLNQCTKCHFTKFNRNSSLMLCALHFLRMAYLIVSRCVIVWYPYIERNVQTIPYCGCVI